jgi:hypothetical protein
MSAPRYAPDHIRVWHVLAAVSEVSPEAVGLCRYRFTLARAPTERRPPESSICCSCLNHERLSVSTPQAKGEENP